VQATRAKARAGTKCGSAESINIAIPLIESQDMLKQVSKLKIVRRALALADRAWTIVFLE
jgi:hypothetical protein